MALSEFALPFTISAAKVAAWSFANEQYDTPVSVLHVQTLSFEPQHATDELKSFGAVERMLSVLEKVNFGMKVGGLYWPALAVMTGMANSDSGSGADEERTNELEGGGNMPYFGFAAVMPTDDATIDLHVYLRLLMLDANPSLAPEQNKFAIPELKGVAGRLRLADGTAHKILTYKVRPAGTALPTDFNTAFGIS